MSYVGRQEELVWDLHESRKHFENNCGTKATLLRLGFQTFGALFAVPVPAVENLYMAGFRTFETDGNFILSGLTIEIDEKYSPFAAVFL